MLELRMEFKKPGIDEFKLKAITEVEMFSNSIIVIPWDFSERSKIALEFALERTPSENIRVICVLEKPDAYRVGANLGERQEEQANEKCAAEFWGQSTSQRRPA